MHLPSVAVIFAAAQLAAAGGSWNCAVFSGGPGADRVAEAIGYYTNAFGGGTHDVAPGNTMTVSCNGIQFGAANTVGYTLQDTQAARDSAQNNAAMVGDGQRCVWSDDTATPYNFDYAAEYPSCEEAGGDCGCIIKDCSGNTIAGGTC